MNKPLVSVIIPNYNYGRYLPETIDSVLAQTYPNIEIIVVDDGSTDDSVEVLKSYGDKIKWFEQTNQGVAKARNRAFAESAGDFIAFLDSDDVWMPRKLEEQLKMFDNGEIGLVHCGYSDFDGKNTLCEYLQGLSGRVADEMLLYKRPVILGNGSGAVITRKAFEKVGGFDSSVVPAEDWEFFYQVARRYKVAFVPEILLEYRKHETNAHLNVGRMEKALLNAYKKIFSEDEANLKPIKRRCYSRIHIILAGSYYQMGNYSQFLRHSVKSLFYSPENISQLFGFPLRWAKRKLKMRSGAAHQ